MSSNLTGFRIRNWFKHNWAASHQLGHCVGVYT